MKIPNFSMSKTLSYRDAGVDIDAGDALVRAIKPFARLYAPRGPEPESAASARS
jgi:phosphoribosylaminoimidazole (AIR) synthetase